MPFRFRRRGTSKEINPGDTPGIAGHLCRCLDGERQERLTLAEIEPGATAEICCLDGEGPLARRLAEMGFIPGTEVEVVRKAPLADPIEFSLRGYLVSLRREEAGRVQVKLISTIASPNDSETSVEAA